MDTPTVLPVQYRDPATTTSWPRILKIIGLFTLIYSAAKLALIARMFRMFWDVWSPLGRMSRPSLWVLSIHYLMEIIVAVLMILGAVQLLRHGASRFILIACRLVIGYWLFALAIGWTFERTEPYAVVLMNQLLFGAEMCIFPLFLLLLLKSWRKESVNHHAAS